jgi:hypothetical protein
VTIETLIVDGREHATKVTALDNEHLRGRLAFTDADLKLVDGIADALNVPCDNGLRQILAKKVADRVREACQEIRLDHSKPS